MKYKINDLPMFELISANKSTFLFMCDCRSLHDIKELMIFLYNKPYDIIYDIYDNFDMMNNSDQKRYNRLKYIVELIEEGEPINTYVEANADFVFLDMSVDGFSIRISCDLDSNYDNLKDIEFTQDEIPKGFYLKETFELGTIRSIMIGKYRDIKNIKLKILTPTFDRMYILTDYKDSQLMRYYIYKKQKDTFEEQLFRLLDNEQEKQRLKRLITNTKFENI